MWLLLALSVAFVVAVYAGYPAIAWLRARLWPRPLVTGELRARVAVVVTLHRESEAIDAKLRSLAAQDYPRELVEVLVAVDGADIETVAAADAAAERWLPGTRVLPLPRGGKARTLNLAVARTSAELLVLTDARQPLVAGAITQLVACFADAEVGAVGGALELSGDAPAGAYWRYERWLRTLEARAGSTVGVSGALWALRRALWRPLPPGTLLDDVLAPMRVRLQGRRVAYAPAAIAHDSAAASGREFRRKVRTLSGNFQLLWLEPRLLLPWRNPSWFEFVAHKLLRLLVPYALVAALVAALLLPRPWALLLGGGQLVGYALAGARLCGLRLPLAGLAETFVVLNAAAVAALFRVVHRRRALPWS